MTPPRFEVLAFDDLMIDAPAELDHAELMSPFVRQAREGDFSLLLRVVHPGEAVTGRVWHGRSSDGLRFRMDPAPLIEPGPDGCDVRGCEDPTVVPTADSCVIYYTGVDAEGFARLLYAEGPDLTRLTKRGIAFARAHTECYTKEATVNCTEEGDWRLFYEYEEGGRSRIGLAIGDGPSNHWHEGKDPLVARNGMWDCWHLSTGPLIVRPGEDPLMFYNGSDRDARWSIGWATFAHDCLSLKHRCETPLIGPPAIDDGDGREIAFAASAIVMDDRIHLYFSRDDRTPHRATIRRC